MNNKINIINIAITYCCINLVVSTEDYDDRTAPDYEKSVSVDSESNELFNGSLKEKPIRERHTDFKSGFINGNVTIDIAPRKNSKSFISNDPNQSKITENQNCEETNLSEYPYSVSIQRKGAHYASGALIHNKWILTVAGEFYNIRESIKLFRARLGSVNCKKGGVLVPLKKIEIHPSYIYNQPGFDLAMLKIGHRVHCSNSIRPISLSDIRNSVFHAKFLATYWPRLMVSGKVIPQSAKERMQQNTMRVSTQKTIPWKKCSNVMQDYNYTLHVSSLCLKPIIQYHSPCMPDVGAPIIGDDGLWGITSGWISDDCSTYPSPTIFTRISLEPITSWLNLLLDEDK